jgi:hypothetical protein
MRWNLAWIVLSTACILYSAKQVIAPEGHVHAIEPVCCTLGDDCGSGVCQYRTTSCSKRYGTCI